MKKIILVFYVLTCLIKLSAQPTTKNNLQFDHLAARWDEAMPLGNGMLGALVWEKDSRLRLSLDRADLWDERKALDISKFNFKWVTQHVLDNNYDTVHTLGDEPYDKIVYPTKLPTGAIEFNISSFSDVVSNTLDIHTALNTITFANGVVFTCYIHALKQQGFFSFENVLAVDTIADIIAPDLITPAYAEKNKTENDNTHAGEGLSKLGYTKGIITKTANSIRYHQSTYNNHYYEILIAWEKISNNHVIGTWTISNDKPATLSALHTNLTEPAGWNEHVKWWKILGRNRLSVFLIHCSKSNTILKCIS